MEKITYRLLLCFIVLIFNNISLIQANNKILTNVGIYHFDKIEFDFKLSPNPAKNTIKINFNSGIIANVLIHDGLGNQVLSERVNNELIKEISLQNLNSGIYFVSVKTNKKTIIKRLIKY